jgi:hypothetical protein
LVHQALLFPYRRAAIILIIGALLSLPIEYLFLQTHGPYEEALGRLVWGLNHHDYSRWAVFPALLILPGIRAFHLWQRDAYGRVGLWGYRLSIGGWLLATLGQIWDYVLFNSWGHPLHGVGFMAQLLAILMIIVGLPAWASASCRSLSGWQLAIPLLWLLYILGLLLSIFTSDETLLYHRYGIDGGFLADVVIAFAFVLMGSILWSKE